MNTLAQLLTDHGHEDLLPRLGTFSSNEVATLATDATIMLTFMRPSMVAQDIAKRISLGTVNRWQPKQTISTMPREKAGQCIKCYKLTERPGASLCIDCAMTKGI